MRGVRCIGSDPRRAHGLAPVLVLADEPAQWPETTGERMVAALRTAAASNRTRDSWRSARGQAILSIWFSKMLAGGADYSQSHAAKPNDKPFQRRTWVKANPSLDHMPDLLDAIRNEAKQARRDPALLASFEALRLNTGTSDTEDSVLLDAGLWTSIEGEAARAGPWRLGRRPWHERGAKCDRGILAGDWPA